MWLDSLKAAGYSPNTLNTRRCQMSALSRALEGDPRDVEGDDLLAHFAGKEWKPETRKGAKNACVSYFRWLRVSGRADSDPSEFLPTVKRPEPHPRPCPDVVILAALSKATEGERLMLRLGAECGLRRFEIAKVHSRDVMRDLVGWSLAVVGKGDKQRIVPIGDDLALLIRSACVCSIESGPCERVDVFHVSGRFWSTSACGEKRTPARPAWTSFPS